jgi:sugar phosphate isomerase/epimerase
MQRFIHTNLFHDRGSEAGVEAAREAADELGFDGVEISSQHLSPLLDENREEELVDTIRSSPLEVIVDAHTEHGASLCHPDREQRNRRVEHIEAILEIGEELDARYLVTSVDPVPAGASKDEVWPLFVDALSEVYDRARNRPLAVAIENDVHNYNETSSDLAFNNLVSSLADLQRLDNMWMTWA